MIPDINKHGNISIFLFLLKIMVKIEKQIAAKEQVCSPTMPLLTKHHRTFLIPPNAKSIVKIVILANFSLRIKKEKRQLEGYKTYSKNSVATVVDVIDKMKHIFDKLNTTPPRSP